MIKWLFLLIQLVTSASFATDDLQVLAENKMWLRLLHYQKNIIGQRVSQVKSPAFFLSSKGSTDSFAEMKATLEALFLKENLTDQHAICRFPARLAFLKLKLNSLVDWSRLPKPICQYYEAFKENLNAQSISFVFSSYFANNPSSAFGHTFFRVNKKGKVGEENPELLDFGVSYAANVSTENPILYVLYGLFGGFSGTYASVPFYFKVREYNDFESRDLWSYDLNLNPKEVEQFVDHLWEVGPHKFDYYFFTQNCSFHMLTLLEAASERLDLTDLVPFYVIPSDAIAALLHEPSLVSKVSFRPSLRRKFQAKWNSLTAEEKINSKEIIESRLKYQSVSNFMKNSPERHALQLDTLIDLIDLKDPKGINLRKGRWYEIKQSMLIERAELKVISPTVQVQEPADERPHLSHPSARMSLGGTQRASYLGFRFAFHDLLDSAVGLTRYSQVEFGHFEWSHQNDRVRWNYFSLFNLLQINPITETENRFSWGVDVGGQLISGIEASFSPGLKVSGGGAFEYDRNLIWLLPFINYRHTSFFSKGPHFVAFGLQIANLFTLSQSAKLLMKYERQKSTDHDDFSAISVSARYRLNFNLSVEAEWLKNSLPRFDDQEELKLKFLYYF